MNPDTTSDPEALLEYLCAFADRRRVARLHQFRDLCRKHHERGSLDFRLATVARLAFDQFDYSETSLRGGSGLAYRQYIHAFARSVGGYTTKPPPGTSERIASQRPRNGTAVPTTTADAIERDTVLARLSPANYLFGPVTDSLILSAIARDIPELPWERVRRSSASEQGNASECPVALPSLRCRLRSIYQDFGRDARVALATLPGAADVLRG